MPRAPLPQAEYEEIYAKVPFEKASETHPDLVFGTVDTEAERELAAAFDIMSIPTLMVLRESVIVYMEPGALPASALEELIGRVHGLDMEDIRRRIAETQVAS